MTKKDLFRERMKWLHIYRQWQWVVIPLGSNRTPLKDQTWTQYREDADAYKRDLEKWKSDGTWERASGIGLLTEFSEVAVFDIDINEPDAYAHLSEVTGLEVTKDSMSYGLSRTQSGQLHIFFDVAEYAGPIPNISSDLAKQIGADHVELKRHGTCVPLPPTVTKKGRYEWIHPPRSDGDPLDPLPEWATVLVERTRDHAAARRLEADAHHAEQERKQEEHGTRIRAARKRGSTVLEETPEEERTRALNYQGVISPTSEGGRYTALTSLMGSLCKAHFSESAVRTAVKEYASRCEPPYGENELDKNVLRKLPDWLDHQQQYRIGTASRQSRPKAVSETELRTAPTDDTSTTTEELEVPSLPDHVRQIEEEGEGACQWLDNYIEHSRKWSPRSYSPYHEACGLWVLSTVAARRVYIGEGGKQYTPLTVLLVGDSSRWKKTTAVNIALGTLRAAELDYLMAADTATPQKFLKDLQARYPQDYDELPSALQTRVQKRLAFSGQRGWHYEEFGGHLRQMTRRDSVYNEFHALLRRLDDCPPHIEHGTVGSGTTYVERPYLSLIGNLTYADLTPFAGKHDAMWHDGFWARFAFYAVPPEAKAGRDRFPRGTRTSPPELIQRLREWHERLGIADVVIEEKKDTKGEATGERSVHVTPREPQALRMDDVVREAFYAYDHHLQDITDVWEHASLNANYTRLPMKALRLAALFASFNGDDTIQRTHWGKAQGIVEGWRRSLHVVHAAMDVAPEHTQQKITAEEKALKHIDEKGALTARQIGQLLHISATEAGELLEKLRRIGEIEDVEIKAKNHRTKIVWQLPTADDRDTDGGRTA